MYRYVFAHSARISAGTGMIGALVLMLTGLHSEGVLVPNAGVLIWVVLAAAPMAVIGWMIGNIFWGMMLGRVVARLQGWPFAVGDRVQILSGKHKDTIALVYEVWAERGQVRVELGSASREKVKDVFCAVAICRARENESNGAVKKNRPLYSEPNQPS